MSDAEATTAPAETEDAPAVKAEAEEIPTPAPEAEAEASKVDPEEHAALVAKLEAMEAKQKELERQKLSEKDRLEAELQEKRDELARMDRVAIFRKADLPLELADLAGMEPAAQAAAIQKAIVAALKSDRKARGVGDQINPETTNGSSSTPQPEKTRRKSTREERYFRLLKGKKAS